MARFSSTQRLPTALIQTVSSTPDLLTGNRGDAWSRDPKSDLFLLALNNLVGQATFYEESGKRDERYVNLVQQVAGTDPDWMQRFIPWLRNEANMRTAAIVAAAEYCCVPGVPNRRKVVESAMSRADEPAEFVAYWQKFHKRAISGGVQRGLQSAVRRLYNERSVLRYNSHEHAMRMADVLELCHVKPKTPWQNALFHYLLDERHHEDEAKVAHAGTADMGENGWENIRPMLPLLDKYHTLMGVPQGERRAHLSEAAEVFSWEQLSNYLGKGSMDKEAWEAMIPQMGYMALLRNLRNFDQAKISDPLAMYVIGKIQDEAEVARSRQLPMRFFSAWQATKSMRWGYALEQALNHSLKNVPELQGHSLVMIDVSGSMTQWPISKDSDVYPWHLATIFGLALAKRNKTTTIIYSSDAAKVHIGSEDSILRGVEQIRAWAGFGQGTATFQTMMQVYDAKVHDRIILVTDEQANCYAGIYGALPTVPIYSFNLMGYAPAHLPSGRDNKYEFGGGLSDATFTLLSMLEQHRDGKWPF